MGPFLRGIVASAAGENMICWVTQAEKKKIIQLQALYCIHTRVCNIVSMAECLTPKIQFNSVVCWAVCGCVFVFPLWVAQAGCEREMDLGHSSKCAVYMHSCCPTSLLHTLAMRLLLSSVFGQQCTQFKVCREKTV